MINGLESIITPQVPAPTPERETWTLRDLLKRIPNEFRFVPLVVADGKGNALPVVKVGAQEYKGGVVCLTLWTEAPASTVKVPVANDAEAGEAV